MGNAQSTIDTRAVQLPWIGQPTTGYLYEGHAYFREFQNATIYAVGDFNPDITKSAVSNAFEVHGSIRGYYKEIGGAKSVIGAPLSDETVTPDGRGRFNKMENGFIYWSPTTGAHEIFGNILILWTSLGAERSWLGYPLTGELAIPGGRMNSFENGQIIWRNGNAVAVRYKDSLVQKYNQVGGIFSRLGLPLSRDMPFVRSGNSFTMAFRGGNIALPLDQPAPAAVASQSLQINWVGLECQVRQEGEDELAGAVSCMALSTRSNISKKFPDGAEPWKLGHNNARIMPTRVLLYDGPPANVIITTTLVELDEHAGDANAVTNRILGLLGDSVQWLNQTGALTGNDVVSGYSREIDTFIQQFKVIENSNLWQTIVNLFNSKDDTYPSGVMELKWDDMRRQSLPKKSLRRNDDPNVLTYTHSVTVTGKDGGGDVGVYAFYFDANVVQGSTPL